MSCVVLNNVVKSFGETVVVHDFNLEVQDKEFLILVGPSGCGKTTTLRMIAGLETATSGDIYIGDRLVNEVPAKDRDIAMVFQSYALYPHMNVYENMAFGLEMRKFSKTEINRRVQEAAEILDIGHLLERKPKALSGGQRQRVALGRAIVREPKVFLMDEPLSNLDAKLRVQMRAELTKLHQRLQTTFIYVTHDQTEAMTMGDRIVVMKDGFIQQVDNPLNLYKYPQNIFVAGFVGLPSMNFFSVEVVADAGSLWLINPCCRIAICACQRNLLHPYVGKAIILGVRPEAFSDDPHFLASHEAWVNDVKVDIVEHMGAETNVYFSFGGANAIARLDNSTLAKAQQYHKIAFDMELACFFDAATQKVIN